MASAPPNPTQLTPPRVAVIDDRTGAISREWYRFFLSLLTSTQATSDATETQPDTNSLMATYDAMLASLTQEVQTNTSDLTASLQQQINDVFTSSSTQPRAELGTMASVQQDNVRYLGFSTVPSPPVVSAPGVVVWDNADGTLDIGMGYDAVTQQVGLQQYYRVKASAAITKGQCIMYTGAVGASGVITAAPATGVVNGQYIMGIATMDIANNDFGYITAFGSVRGFNTTGASVGETWVDGDILYYNPAYTGGLTKVPPTAPLPKIVVAAVTNAGSGGSGSLFARVQSEPELKNLSDVYAPSPILNGQILIGDGPQSRWEAATLTAGTAISVTNGAGSVTITNTAPDQIVSLTAGTGISISGTYPSFTITNTLPDQIVSLTGAGTTVVTGTYPSFTITSNDQYVGTVTSVSGTGSVNGITLTGTVTSSGSLTLGGTLSGVSLTTQVSGTLPVGNGGTGTATAFTAGSVVFAGASGVYSQDNANLFWDDANNRLGVGNASPGATLDVTGNIRLSAANPNIELNNGGPMVYSPGVANTLSFATGGGPSTPVERFRIGSAGQWGIGGATYGTAGQVFTSGGALAAPTWTTPTTGTVTSVSGTGTVNGITLTGTVTSSGSLTLGGTLSGVSLTTQVSGTLPVGNGGTGATTFTSGYLLKGNGGSAISVSVAYDNGSQILIGTTTGTAASVSGLLQVESEIISKGSLAGFFFENRSGGVTAGSNWFGWYNSGGTTYFYNPAVGNIASINSATGAYTALSDAAKKKDFEPSAVGLDAVLALKPTLFRMDTDADDAPKQLGFVAQEVKNHIPQAYVEEQNTDAGGNESTYIGLNDRPIIAALVKAVQDLKAEIDELKR